MKRKFNLTADNLHVPFPRRHHYRKEFVVSLLAVIPTSFKFKLFVREFYVIITDVGLQDITVEQGHISRWAIGSLVRIK